MKVNQHIKFSISLSKCLFYYYILVSLNNEPCPSRKMLVLRTSPSNVPRTSPKDPIWPSRWRLDLTSWGRSNVTSWGRANLTFKGRSQEVDSGCPQDVLRTSPKGSPEYSSLDVPAFFVNFLSELIRLTNLSNSIWTHKVY